MSAISATVTLDGKLDGDVRDEETVDIELLVLGVGLGVLQQVQDVLAALPGPSALSGLLYIPKKKDKRCFLFAMSSCLLFVYVELLDLSLAADLARVSAEGDDLLLRDDVGEVSLGASESHALDGSSSLSGVLEVHTEINTSCLASCSSSTRTKKNEKESECC